MSEPVHTSEAPATGAPETKVFVGDREVSEIAAVVKSEQAAAPKPTETVDYWKQMSRKNEEQAKANADAAKRLKDIEDRDLSELQRERRDREAAATENGTLKTELARLRVAVAKGLPAEIAATLNGANEEELAAHADRLIAWRGNVPPTTPRPDAGQGPRPSAPQADEDAEYARYFPDQAR